MGQQYRAASPGYPSVCSRGVFERKSRCIDMTMATKTILANCAHLISSCCPSFPEYYR